MRSVKTIVVGLLLAVAAHGAISFDATAAGRGDNVGGFSFSLTVGSGQNRVLICGVYSNDSTGNAVSGVSYNGAAMTLITSQDLGVLHPIRYYWLAAPATGAHSVSVIVTDMFHSVAAGCASYSGVSQTAPTNFSAGSSSSPLTLTLTTASDNSWLTAIAMNNSEDAMSAGIGTTLRGTLPSLAGDIQVTDSNAAIHPVGSAGLSYTGDSTMKGIIVELSPALASGVPAVLQGVRMSNIDNTGQAIVAGGSATIPLPRLTLAGNALIVSWMAQRAGGGLNPGTMTVTDDAPGGSNTYTLSSTFAGMNCNANGNYLYVAVAPNIKAGTSRITISPQQSLVFFTAAAEEVTNIATTNPIDAFGCHAGGSGTTVTAGSITPSQSGDFLYHWTWDEVDASPGVVTAGSQAGITWDLKSVDSIQGSFLQDGVYNSTSPITPTLTVANDNGWGSVVMALKSASAGTPDPGGMEIFWAHHFIIPNTFSTTYDLQVPAKGNLLVDMFGGGGADCISATSTTPANTISDPGCTLNGADMFVDAHYIAAPSLTGGGLIWSFTQPSTISDYNHIIFDVKGAASSPFDVEAHATGNQAGTGNWNTVTITPSTSGGLIFSDVMVEFNTVNSSLLSGSLLQNGYLGTNSAGNTPYDENNGWASYLNSSAASKTFGWSVMPGLDANTGTWASQALAFKSPAPGVSFRHHGRVF